MRILRRNLAIALIVRGVLDERRWLERLGARLLPVRPAWRCPACHGTGYAWDAASDGRVPCECLLN